MKRTLLSLITLAVLLTNCRKAPLLSLSAKKPDQVIALQPLNDYNVQQLQAVIAAVQQFYNKPVIVLSPVTLSPKWYNAAVQSYAADSIIERLSARSNNRIVEVIGLTHQPIFTIKENARGAYFDNYIIGLGYQPGNACVVSDYNMSPADPVSYTHRMRNAILHEIGHNMGLPHCPNDSCIMSEKNEGSDYCAHCRSKLVE